MSDADFSDAFFFSWEGAEHPDGPWHHLRVLEFEGEERISEPFWFEVQLYRDGQGPDVSVQDLVGASAALKIETKVDPPYRIVHGVITSAREYDTGAKDGGGGRYRVTMRPAFHRAAVMRKSIIYLQKTLRQIIESVLERTALGASLEKSTTLRPPSAGDGLGDYRKPKLTYVWALGDIRRIDDVDARPYCVQYDESDFDFVSRLLEEEGISYHFEHGESESILVLTDIDAGRNQIDPNVPFGPEIRGHEVIDFCDGAVLRPASVHLDDYNWERPHMNLRAISPAGVTDFTDIRHPGRYLQSQQHGEALAEKREQRFDTERRPATAEGVGRLLTAGDVFVLEHPRAKFCGPYLVTVVRHRGLQPNFAAEQNALENIYRQKLEFLRCGTADQAAESRFRPGRHTPRPRIYGSQTAIVTADPSNPDAEIHVGGPSDLGCVRVRFHWDMDEGRWAIEPTSCWVRVSQFFAGRDHGALWHPRVGDEVIVEFIDGDPDRPLVTGRVYNGVNPAPENATARPTYSAIKSNTSPYDGNYNMLAFEDLQGSEEITLHAARDFVTNVEHNSSRSVANFDKIHVVGDQEITVDGERKATIGGDEKLFALANRFVGVAESNKVSVTGLYHNESFSQYLETAPIIGMSATILSGVGTALLNMNGGQAFLSGKAFVSVAGPMVRIDGTIVTVSGASVVNVNGATVNVSGGTVNVKGDGGVNITGASVNLNC